MASTRDRGFGTLPLSRCFPRVRIIIPVCVSGARSCRPHRTWSQWEKSYGVKGAKGGPFGIIIIIIMLRMERTGEERDERATSAALPSPVGKCCGRERETRSAGWKAMLTPRSSGTSSCTDAMHTCKQSAVFQHMGESRHTHEHEQGKLVPHHTQAAATHNHHWPNQERLISEQTVAS